MEKLGETRESTKGVLMRVSPEDGERLKLFPKLVKALEEVTEAFHQTHLGRFNIPVGKGICDLAPCRNSMAVLAKVKALEVEE